VKSPPLKIKTPPPTYGFALLGTLKPALRTAYAADAPASSYSTEMDGIETGPRKPVVP
jgi:hypothetical protein